MENIVEDIVEKDISLAITTMVHHALIHYSNFIKFTVMKKILFFLFAFLAFQYTVAQSIFERKSIGNNVYVSTNTSEKKAESIRNFSFAEESLYAPPVILQGSVFLDEICNKYKSQGVKGWMNFFLYSDLNGCITDITLAFPEGLTVTDDDVSLILSTAQKKCKLQFPIEGIYKYKDWAIYDYVFYLTN